MPVARKASTREDRRCGERDREGHEIGGEMIVACRQEHCRRIPAHREQARVAERREARVADQDVEREREDGPEQDLAGNVDVVGVADPDRQCREQHEHEGDGGALGRNPAHETTLPNRPCGRSTRIASIGRNRMT